MVTGNWGLAGDRRCDRGTRRVRVPGPSAPGPFLVLPCLRDLGSDQVAFFRDLITGYEQEQHVPAADIAAALAVLVQDDQPLLLVPEAEPAPRRVFDGKRDGDKGGVWDHEKGRRRDRFDDDRAKRRETRPKRGRSEVPMATYTIAVGKRHKVEPRQIVGAIANEGGLNRTDFGHIDIRGDLSLVELPAHLSPETLAALERTRISGKLIDLSLDDAQRPARSAAPNRQSRTKKPRH